MLPEYFSHDFLERLFFISGIATTGVAFYALIYAKQELSEAKQNSEIIARHRDVLENQSRSTLLLRLEEKWSSPRLVSARKYFIQTHKRIHDLVLQNGNADVDTRKEQMFFEELNKLLEDTMKGVHQGKDASPYETLMEVVGFFELLGLLVKRQYITLDDIGELFAGPIIDLGKYAGRHLEDRASNHPVRGLYSNALFLVRETRTWHQSQPM